MAGNCCKFAVNITRLVIRLLNCKTGHSNFTQRVWQWLPWPCYKYVCRTSPETPHLLLDRVDLLATEPSQAPLFKIYIFANPALP